MELANLNEIKEETLSKKKHSKEQLLEILVDFRGQFNRYPTRKDFEEKKIEPSRNTFIRIFGSMKRAIGKAGEIRQERTWKPKEVKKTRSAKLPRGFQCSFCGEWNTGIGKYHDNITKVIVARCLALLESNGSNDRKTYHDAVFDCTYELFGENSLLINEALEQEGYLEKFKERYSDKNNKKAKRIICPFCGKHGYIEENHYSPLKRVMSMRFIELLKSNNRQTYLDGVLDSIYTIFKRTDNPIVRTCLETAGCLERFSELYGNEQEDQLLGKEKCPVCRELKESWDMTVDDSLIAKRICEDCYSESPKKKLKKEKEVITSADYYDPSEEYETKIVTQ